MASFELLDAVNLRDVRTTADVAARLGVDKREAATMLREAQREGLVHQEEDRSVNVPRDFNREFWHLTENGRHAWERLDAGRADG